MSEDAATRSKKIPPSGSASRCLRLPLGAGLHFAATEGLLGEDRQSLEPV